MARELRKQGYDKPIVGETVLTSQKVIELAGDLRLGPPLGLERQVDVLQPGLAVRGHDLGAQRRKLRGVGAAERLAADGRGLEQRVAPPHGLARVGVLETYLPAQLSDDELTAFLTGLRAMRRARAAIGSGPRSKKETTA